VSSGLPLCQDCGVLKNFGFRDPLKVSKIIPNPSTLPLPPQYSSSNNTPTDNSMALS